MTAPLSVELRVGALIGRSLDGAVDVAVRAFDDDPFFSYLFPGEHRRHRSVALLHRAVLVQLGPLGTLRTAYVDGKVAGVALWIPPGAWPYPPAVQARQLLGAIHAFFPNVAAFGRAGRILRSVEASHVKRPQWYLQLLMVDPDLQRLGIGMQLQAPELATCDAQGLPAWVETQKPENLAYYRRFGFEVVTEHRPDPRGPAMWSLSREPRS